MQYKTILTDFLEWYVPADGDIYRALIGYVANYPESPRNYEKATAARIFNYATRHGIDLYLYADRLEAYCCGIESAGAQVDSILAKLAA